MPLQQEILLDPNHPVHQYLFLTLPPFYTHNELIIRTDFRYSRRSRNFHGGDVYRFSRNKPSLQVASHPNIPLAYPCGSVCLGHIRWSNWVLCSPSPNLEGGDQGALSRDCPFVISMMAFSASYY